MNPFIAKEFQDAVDRSTDALRKDYARLKTLEDEFNKLTMLLEIASSMNVLEGSTEIRVTLTSEAMRAHRTIAEALRASIWRSK